MKLHLCCGLVLWGNGWTNVDMGDFGQEIKADLNQPWKFAGDGTVSQIECKDGFEHVASAEHFLAEAAASWSRAGHSLSGFHTSRTHQPTD